MMNTLSRRSFLGLTTVLFAGCRAARVAPAGLFQSRVLTHPGDFTAGIEGPAVDARGRLFAVNCRREHTIGLVHPDGSSEVYVELPGGSTGNGIRFDSHGRMMVADYTGHNILAVDMDTRKVTVHAHEPAMSQPNDVAINASDVIFASDPDWKNGTGRIWRILPTGETDLLAADMGTTNGIEVSPEGTTLYVNESVQRRVWAFDLTRQGLASNKRLFASFSDFGMDGMRCDRNGNLFVARYDKGVVAVLRPDGSLVREIPLHGKRPTNVTFGGEDGRTVYVTLQDTTCIETFRTDVPGAGY